MDPQVDRHRQTGAPSPLQADRHAATKLLAWQASPQGKILLGACEDLILRHLFYWGKSGRTVLEVNCGTGLLQQSLRCMGLDVTGCEPSPTLREIFQRTLGFRSCVDPAHADLLPYPDGHFDWVLLHLERGTPPDKVTRALREARRVAVKGLAALVWNRASLPWLCHRDFPLTALAAPAIFRQLGTWGEGRRAVGATFFFSPHQQAEQPAPSPLPRNRFFLRKALHRGRMALTTLPVPALFGGLCLIRLDLPPARPMTATPITFRQLSFGDSRLAEGCSDRVPCRDPARRLGSRPKSPGAGGVPDDSGC